MLWVLTLLIKYVWVGGLTALLSSCNCWNGLTVIWCSYYRFYLGFI